MLKDNRNVKRYSEPFKLKVLSELSSGKYTKCEIIRIYGKYNPFTIKKFIFLDHIQLRLSQQKAPVTPGVHP